MEKTKIRKTETESRELAKARRILASTPLVGKLENSIEFLEFLHELKVSKDNPFWIIADECYDKQLKASRKKGEDVEPYFRRYCKLFRKHKKSLEGVEIKGETFPGEFRESVSGKYNSQNRFSYYNHTKTWRE